MKKETILTVSVVLLVLINLSTLGFLVWGNKHPHQPPPPVNKILIEELKWNPAQQTSFNELKHQHRSAMNLLDKENYEVVTNYFKLLATEPIDTSIKITLENKMAEIEAKKASITFLHFQDLKKLGNAEQARKFDSLIPQLIQILIPPTARNRPRRNKE